MSILRVLIINSVRVNSCKWMSYQPPSTHWSCKLFLGTRNDVRNIILRRETGPVMSFKTSIYILGNNSRINSVFWECISLDFLIHYYLMWIIMIHIGYCELINKMLSNIITSTSTYNANKAKLERRVLLGAKTLCKKDCWKI